MTAPRSLFVDGLLALDAPDLRKRLSLAIAAVKAADIEAGGSPALKGALRRVEADLASSARLAVQDLALALAEHERDRGPPPDTPAPPVAPVRPARLPPIPPRNP